MTKKLTKVSIEEDDKLGGFTSLQQWLTMRNNGKPASQAQVMKWLLELGLKVKANVSRTT